MSEPVTVDWDVVLGKIGARLSALMPAEYQAAAHHDIRFSVTYQDLMAAVEDGLGDATDLPVERSNPFADPPTIHTVRFSGGPWDGQTADIERIVAPVFAVGHEIGNHYWLDTNSGNDPTYFWDGPTGGSTPNPSEATGSNAPCSEVAQAGDETRRRASAGADVGEPGRTGTG